MVLQFKKTGKLIIKVDDFKKIMEVPEAYDRDFGLIRSKVINPSIKEIRVKDGLDISYAVTKTGRKVTGLEFTFPPEQQKTLPLKHNHSGGTPKVSRAYIEKHAKPGESYEQARIRLESNVLRRNKAA